MSSSVELELEAVKVLVVLFGADWAGAVGVLVEVVVLAVVVAGEPVVVEFEAVVAGGELLVEDEGVVPVAVPEPLICVNRLPRAVPKA